MFDTLLIANRSEIACRIIRTANAMGLRTVAVFSDADRNALHVQMADHAVHIGAAPARDSYLRIDRIIDAAQRSGAQAIHPGYGFLSERADMAEACVKAGLVWVGPHADAIRQMGDKITAKSVALAADMPCIPGYAGADQADGALIQAARDIGLPVMIKASAGGGGKGMRAVFDPAGLPAAITTARAEAERAFGDGRLMVEKLVQNPRHIEVQLLGDKHGSLLHLFERDCSVQRNHQKLLEEAPAPNLRDDTRQALYAAALRLGRQIGYDSAGTVEFIMDAETEAFHFLEMNTRLQVEHTVTEEITGLDLVEWQLRVAAGERLTLAQSDITATGHAIEARLTAEDPANGFRPDTGRILHWASDPDLRCDSGVRAGSVIDPNYDSMMAKLIAHGPDRAAAVQMLKRGLARSTIVGVQTNRLFLCDALGSQVFQDGTATTDFIPSHWPDGWQPVPADTLTWAALALHSRPRPAPTPWQGLRDFRLLALAGLGAHATYVDTHDAESPVTITPFNDALRVETGGQAQDYRVSWRGETTLCLEQGGDLRTVKVHFDGDLIRLSSAGAEATHRIVALGDLQSAHSETTQAAPDRVTAPMPGLVAEIRVAEGDRLQAGDTVAMLESMKLLMELKCTAPGTVTAVRCAVGDTIGAGQVLVSIESENDPEKE